MDFKAHFFPGLFHDEELIEDPEFPEATLPEKVKVGFNLSSDDSRPSFYIFNTFQVLEIPILGPNNGTLSPSRCYDNTVGKGKLEFMSDLCGGKGDADIQICNRSSMHQSDSLQSIIFSSLLEDSLEYLQEAEGGHNQVVNILDSRGVKVRIRTVGEIFKPAAGIDYVHIRSFSRLTVVSIPLKKPRICLGFFRGMSSMRFS
jgi:hypothetical protein